MAAAYQAERTAKKKNNVWGSIIEEQTLNSSLSGFGVNRSQKDFASDRGAEAYDFIKVQEEKAREREKKREEMKKEGRLDKEIEDYWGREEEEDKKEQIEDKEEVE